VHELSLASAVIDTATRHADGRRVTAVHLRVGHLRQVVPDSLSFYFEHVAAGTPCEGARLSLEAVPAELRCHGCGHAWEPAEAAFRCPGCEGADVAVVAGEEFEVEWINVEQVEAKCTA
jgi:hydrogenase nickel incorporation protein HypA/HybF